ncbi:MAG: S-adenosyl-l-methionine hydroxide adenosyltransferase family protein, partial [Candidatus Limnocylindrales bacterium]
MPERPFISLLSDFGLRDPSAGIMRAVVLGIAPRADIVDLSHDVAKYQVRDGALILWCAAPYLPVGAHVAVVDPGVGTERRPIGLRTRRGDVLVGPDNGLLVPAADRLGGIVAAHVLAAAAYRLPVVSRSFHGRDIFAPAAAHLANGVVLEAFGPALDQAELVRLPWPEASVSPGVLAAAVLYVDTFGNVKLGAESSHLVAALGEIPWGTPLRVTIQPGRASTAPSFVATWSATFGHVSRGSPLLYEDSYGRLCLAVNQGDAAAR